MSFSDILQSILGFLQTDWLQTLVGVLYLGGGTALFTLDNKARKRYKETEVVNTNNLKSLDKNIKETNNTQNKLKEQVDNLQESMFTLVEAISAIGNIISSVYLETKAVSKDTKISISKYVSILSKLGMNTKTVEEITKAIEVTKDIAKKAIEDIQEEQQKVADDSKVEAEKTEEKLYEIYQKIIDNND